MPSKRNTLLPVLAELSEFSETLWWAGAEAKLGKGAMLSASHRLAYSQSFCSPKLVSDQEKGQDILDDTGMLQSQGSSKSNNGQIGSTAC